MNNFLPKKHNFQKLMTKLQKWYCKFESADMRKNWTENKLEPDFLLRESYNVDMFGNKLNF